MAKVYGNSAEVLAERAMEPDQRTTRLRAADPSGKAQERRLIFSGTMPVPPQSELPPGTTLPPTNRRFTKRRVSPFNIILLLMGTAAGIVLYISNVIAVNQLVNDIHKSDVRLQNILSEQEILKAHINQISSLEHVRKRAEEELGLRNPTDVPRWLNVDQDKIRTIEEAAREN
jgi:cell division protein FtsB